MSALFPSRNPAQKLSYAWCRRHCSSIQEPGAHGGMVVKKSAAVCASLSIKVLDYSIFRLIMHKNPGFAAFYLNKKPVFYSLFRLIMHNNPGICSNFQAHYAQKSWNVQNLWNTMHKNPRFCSIFRFNMRKKAQYLYFVCSTWTAWKLQLLSVQTHKTSSTTAEDPRLLFCPWRVSTYLGFWN